MRIAALKGLLAAALALGCGVASAQSSWSGFYGGLQLGVGTQTALFEDTTSTIWGGEVSRSKTTAAPGLQLGYNWLSNSLLLGLEADFNGSSAKNSATLGNPCGGCAVANVEAKVSWFSTLRARMGIVVNPNDLVYLTGGVALAKQKWQVNLSDGVNSAAVDPTSATSSGSVFGVGLEHKLSGRTSLKVEYLNVALNREESRLTSAAFGFTNINYGVTQSISLFRIGANWAF